MYRKLGFTLVELLVVMAIMGILAVVIFSNFTTAQAKGRDSQRKSDLKQIANALELYYANYGAYPTSGSGHDHEGHETEGSILACCHDDDHHDCHHDACSWSGDSHREFVDENNTVYMKEIPNDPISSQHYCYYSDGTLWRLFATLENPNDSDKTEHPVACGGETIYNFGITSSNALLEDEHNDD